MDSTFRQLLGIHGAGLGGIVFVLGFLSYFQGYIGLTLFLILTLPSGLILLASADYRFLEYQTLAVLNGPT